MPLELPNLDDRNYTDLVEEALALIPAHAPEWTNHNPSDPGITLVELFAYLTEMLIYRLNRVTEANQEAFLQLLNGSGWKYDKTKTLNQNIQDVVLKLREEPRAVTVEDFERLARAATKNKDTRAYCLPRWDLDSRQRKEGHISVVIVPVSEDLIKKVKDDLMPRCLITTSLHVVGPSYLKLRIQVRLRINPDAIEQKVRLDALSALKSYFHPVTGGVHGTGWRLGQNVYVSELYALLDKLPGVDYVEKNLTGNNTPLEELVPEDNSRRILNSQTGQLVGVRLEADELIDFQATENDIQVVRDTKDNRNR